MSYDHTHTVITPGCYRCDLNEDEMRAQREDELADAIQDFINANVYNGAPDAGQAVYNYGGNPWLQEQVRPFVQRYIKEQDD